MAINSSSFVQGILSKIFGSSNDRTLKRARKVVGEIASFETQLKALSSDDLKGKTEYFREKFLNGDSLDVLLPEAFAVVREVSCRVLNMRHFDEQMIGGMMLHEGKIAEMRTGEGKTLAATLPVYLNALSGKSVHVVTVNDYLAQRDSEWMGKLYNALGLSVGVIVSGMEHQNRKAAYACDITYGTNNEFGFDYLRDNMSFNFEQQVQRDLTFAVIDEVDSILIDEARTPLIISGPADDRSDIYTKINDLVAVLVAQTDDDETVDVLSDYTIDEKSRQVYLTESGHEHVERILIDAGLLDTNDSLYSASNISLVHHVYAAIRAQSLFQRDVDYVIQNGQVVIVDEFTGRTMPGRRWSDGLHQAVEAKEGLVIQEENQTLASITYQNYFRLYDNLSGMTGTADTEAHEFQEIYNLEVVVIPTHKAMIREDYGDLVYLSQTEKFQAILEDIQNCVERGQPVLVGTTSIETSEYLSNLLKKNKIKHEVLNAKFHEQEASIIANAGTSGSVTVATNMAGRGTDIVLGGNPDFGSKELEEASKLCDVNWEQSHQNVLDAGGLHIIGTERHESRRIDNQLRGRSGRQGDAGSSRFYLSLEDSLMRIFASEKVSGLMKKLGMDEGEAIEHPWVSKAIENAQRKVEGRNFDVRKQLLEFDDVANDQRTHVYAQRREIMQADSIRDMILQIRDDVVSELVDRHLVLGGDGRDWNLQALAKGLKNEVSIYIEPDEFLNIHDLSLLREKILEGAEDVFIKKEEMVGYSAIREFEKSAMLQVLDTNWKEHLAAMDHLRQGIHLRGFAQKNPKQEYKREAFEMFSVMLDQIKRSITKIICGLQISTGDQLVQTQRKELELSEENYQRADHSEFKNFEKSGVSPSSSDKPFVRKGQKIGRNDLCPCGSQKKYKLCHGKT